MKIEFERQERKYSEKVKRESIMRMLIVKVEKGSRVWKLREKLDCECAKVEG